MRIENVQGAPMAWVTPDTVDGQTVNGKPRRVWWENNEGVGIPIYTTPQPAYLPLDLPLFARRMDEELEKHDIQGFEPVVLAVAEEVMGYEQQPAPDVAGLVEALVAIKARIRGEFDHPALLKQGPLGELRDDIERIIDSALAANQQGGES